MSAPMTADPLSIAAWRANRISVDPIRCTWWLYALIAAVVGDPSLDHELDQQLAAIKTFGEA